MSREIYIAIGIIFLIFGLLLQNIRIRQLKNRIKEEERLRHNATHDELTNLYNRRSFNEIFQKEIENINKMSGVSYFVIIDLDNFKAINDNYGHCEGDNALCKMADGMRYCLNQGESYARISGDEFVVIFRNVSGEEAKKRLDDIREYLKNNYKVVKLEFSYGIVEIDPRLNLQHEEIFYIADRRLYEAKKNKKVGR